MSRETKYTGIILKKQPFGESDEIITFFTKEQGKIRALAKSVKSPKSKLQGKLQTLFLVDLTVAGKKLPKIISAETQSVFANLRGNLSASKRAFFALELALRFTPDEQKNERLFDLLLVFFHVLEGKNQHDEFDAALAKFKVEILEALGLGIAKLDVFDKDRQIFFSKYLGGFAQTRSQDSTEVSLVSYNLFEKLHDHGFDDLTDSGNTAELQNLLSGFIEYQLERSVKSEKYLNS